MLRLRTFIVVESSVQDKESTNVSRLNPLTSTTKSSDSGCFEQV